MENCHPSQKHYRAHHEVINKEIEYFDNDGIFLCQDVGEEDTIDTTVGINKRLWKFDDCANNDEEKDGNIKYSRMRRKARRRRRNV